jgi:hypothetical protein
MEYPLSKGMRAPVEQLFRAVIKNFFLNETPPADDNLLEGILGGERILPPCMGEMGAEIRYHIARVEPWIRNGWKIATRRPAFYPEGSAIDVPDFFRAADEVMHRFAGTGSHGSIHIPPMEFGRIDITREIDGTHGRIEVELSDVTKVTKQAMAEIDLRELFMEWFYFEGRPLNELDRHPFAFTSTAVGNFEYNISTALRPSFLPPTFVNPKETVPPHVGVQMRKMDIGLPEEPRNSNPARMMLLANEIAAHLGVEVLVYGHPKGCHLPTTDVKKTWDASRAEGHLARELGYLSTCRLMLSPDSGWADLMAWLNIPTLLEQVYAPFAFEPLRVCFGGKLKVIDPRQPIEPQADEIIAAAGPVLPECLEPPVNPVLFPWEP